MVLTGAALCSGVLVVNCPRATVQPVSDHAIGLIFALTRSIARQAALVASGVWDRAAALLVVDGAFPLQRPLQRSVRFNHLSRFLTPYGHVIHIFPNCDLSSFLRFRDH